MSTRHPTGSAGSPARRRSDGIEVDRYYHAVTLTDQRVIDLATELGLGDAIRWRPLGVGFFHDGALASMTTPRELLRFPGLSAADRARLVALRRAVQADLRPGRARRRADRAVDAPPSGDRLWERLWRPLLDSKFDGRFDDLPATYLWSRMRRTAGTRDRSGREVMGWIRGGHQALADALRDAIRASGGEVLTGEPVRSILSTEGRVQGVVVGRWIQAPRLGGLDAAPAAPVGPCWRRT